MTLLYNENTFLATLPNKPYCTNDLNFGLKIRPAEQAIKMRYVQPNSPTDLRWLVYDVDRQSAHYDWQDVHAPTPNFTVMNPENGHAHLFYGLEMPVFMQMGARKNPIRYVSSIDVALTKTLQADEQYAKLISKNPFHKSWTTHFWRSDSYDLDELADWLDLSGFQDQRKRLPSVGLGRNCNLFDITRFWAYKAIREPVQNYLFEEMYGKKDFVERCIEYAALHNHFPGNSQGNCLGEREVYAIGKSVGSWVFEHMSPSGFKEWAQKRRERSALVRHQISEERRSEAQILADKGFLRVQIANELGVTEKTIQRMHLVYPI